MKPNHKTVYLAGKISGDDGYREKFALVEERLKRQGYTVISPAILPSGLSYNAYIRISSSMLDECDYIYLLPDWQSSNGAKAEFQRAKILGITRLSIAVDIPTDQQRGNHE